MDSTSVPHTCEVQVLFPQIEREEYVADVHSLMTVTNTVLTGEVTYHIYFGHLYAFPDVGKFWICIGIIIYVSLVSGQAFT